MNFGDAITLMKAGHKMQRSGWNGKGLWVELQKPDDNSKMTLPYLFLSYPDGRTVPWLASQTDVLEEDWLIYQDVPVTQAEWGHVANYSEKEFNKDLRTLMDDAMVFKQKKPATLTLKNKQVDALKNAGFWKSKSVIVETSKKPHWTQTPEGKKKIAARKKRGWKK